MSVFSNSLWHGDTPPLPRWSWFDKCIPNRAAPFRVTAPGPGDSIIPWAWHCTSEAVQLLPETTHLMLTQEWLPRAASHPSFKSSFKCSSAQAYYSLRHYRESNVLVIVHQYSQCDARTCLWKHSVLFSSYFMSLRTAVYPLSLYTNFASFKYRKLHQYKRKECLFFLLPPRTACWQVWKHLDFSVRRMSIYYVFFLMWKNTEIFLPFLLVWNINYASLTFCQKKY